MALMLPTEESTGAQSSSLTVALVTTSGGGTIFLPAEAIVTICRPLIKTSTMNTPTTAKIAQTTIFREDFFTVPFMVSGLATSCISWFALRLKQQAPKSAGHLELTCAPFRC